MKSFWGARQVLDFFFLGTEIPSELTLRTREGLARALRLLSTTQTSTMADALPDHRLWDPEMPEPSF